MEVYDVAGAATKLKVRPSTLLKYIRKGKLQARRFGNSGYRISEQSLEAFLVSPEDKVKNKCIPNDKAYEI